MKALAKLRLVILAITYPLSYCTRYATPGYMRARPLWGGGVSSASEPRENPTDGYWVGTLSGCGALYGGDGLSGATLYYRVGLPRRSRAPPTATLARQPILAPLCETKTARYINKPYTVRIVSASSIE